MELGAPRCVWPIAALLGEGPVWIGGALWFVDIKRRQVHCYTPATDDKASWNAPEQIGFLVPACDGFVAGLQSGLHRFDPDTGDFTLLARVEPQHAGNRLNDATVDRSGRLWFGSMDDSETDPSGSFYRFHDGVVQPAGVDGITITNGPALSPDGQLIYLVDTLRGTIDVADVGDDAVLTNRRGFVRIDPADGHPDGPTVDAEGCVWIGLYGGWAARRYSPSGDLLQTVRFPVANITKIAFGGDDLRTVFATTARQKLTAADLERQQDAGGLFSFRAQTAGLPCPLVAC
jgi:xylono-1,5-lactonase